MALLAYALLAAALTWPLLRDARTLVASDTGDPILNTAILVWNASVTPLTEAWWAAPHFYPAQGVVAFTENLLGLYPLASPLYWLTGNPVLTYNLTLFLMWPLSAWAVYLLTRRLVAWEAAAFVAGLLFVWSPMRAVALPHIQTMATFGVPCCLLALHAYLRDGRRGWLLLFGVAWMLQGFANGYYILYGGLIVGLWALFFAVRPASLRALGPVVAAGAVASLPLVPMLLRYRAVHDEAGAKRSLEEIGYFSALPGSWFEVGGQSWLWRHVLAEGKDNLFPGLTVLALIVAGLVAWRRSALAVTGAATEAGRAWPSWRRAAAVVALLTGLLVAFVLWHGPIDATIVGVRLRIRQLDRALLLFVLAGGAVAWSSAWLSGAWRAREPFLFYGAGALVFAVLSFGPVLRAHGQVVLNPAPYGWLMVLPGFDELRVPTQIKMLVLLCLAVSGGLALDRLRPAGRAAARALFVVVAVAALADGWLLEMPMAEPQPLWAAAEPPGRAEPLLELPLGPAFDGGATLRAAQHRRRVMNGVSGYDPPFYAALKEGLALRDPALLAAVAALGPMDVVVDGSADPDGAIARYVESHPGARRIGGDGVRVVYRLPKAEAPGPLGAPLTLAAVRAVRHADELIRMTDGNPETAWEDVPAGEATWVEADLGAPREVGGVTLAMGRAFFDYPRRVRILTSLDGQTWTPAWDGPTYAGLFLGFVRTPRNGEIPLRFPPVSARVVRVERLDHDSPAWRVAELRVHAP